MIATGYKLEYVTGSATCSVPHSLRLNKILEITEVNFLYISIAPAYAIDLVSVPHIHLKVKAWPSGKTAQKALQRN